MKKISMQMNFMKNYFLSKRCWSKLSTSTSTSRRKTNLSSTTNRGSLLQSYTLCPKQCHSRVPSVSQFLNAGLNTQYRQHHSVALQSLDAIRKEKQKTLKDIDKNLPGHISRKMIEDEIQVAALRMEGVDYAELGPSGVMEYYFHDTITGSRSFRRRNVESGEEQPVFSVNVHLKELGPMSLSVDEQYAARLITSIDRKGNQKIIIRDIKAGTDFHVNVRTDDMHKDGITSDSTRTFTIYNVEFGPMIQNGNDNFHSFFYTTCDSKGRPNAVYGCVIFDNELGHGKHHSIPELVLIDHEGSNFVDIQRTKGCDHVAIHSTSKTSNEIHLVGKDLSPKLVRRRQTGVQYFVDCGINNDVIIMAHTIAMTKSGKGTQNSVLGSDFKVFETKTDELPLGEYFGKEISARFQSTGRGDTGDYFIEDMDLFDSHICFYERSFGNGAQRIRVYNRKCETDNILSVHENNREAYSITPSGNMNFASSHFQFNVESPVNPPVNLRYDFDMFVGHNVSLGESVRKSDNPYSCQRVLVESHDGTKCPLTIVFNESVKMPSMRPVVLIGYSCYGQNQNLQYDPIIMPLVDRGFAIAYCHGRGGRELGQNWYEAGRLGSKKKSVEDYTSCAQYLKSNDSILRPRYSNEPTFTVARAFSAGGIVVGASINENPGLFHAATLTNAFLDVMGSMSDITLHLTEHEFDEFGDPRTEEACAWIKSYCPLTNVKTQSYPSMFVVGALDDNQVPATQAISFVRKIRGCDPGANILLSIEEEGGHHLSLQRLQVGASEICFILGNYHSWLKSIKPVSN